MTIGVEVELQLLDAKTKELTLAAPAIFEALGGEKPHIKPEIFQSMLEITSGVCHTVADVRRDLEDAISELTRVCSKLGLEMASAGSHPFAKFRDGVIYPAERFRYLIDRNQWLAHRLMIFGLHVHVGMINGNHAISMINAMIPYLPHLLALSASSPFWEGIDTGLASSRITIFEALPTAGHPSTFENWKAFESFYDSLLTSSTIKSIKDIWWDIRPHPDFGTVEVRMCDGLPTLSEMIAMVALIRSMFAWFQSGYLERKKFPITPDWMIRENKWRASRWGLEAAYVLNEKGMTRPLRKEVEQLLSDVEPYARALNCSDDLKPLHHILEHGGSYLRQRKIYEREKSLRAVADSLVREFKAGVPEMEIDNKMPHDETAYSQLRR